MGFANPLTPPAVLVLAGLIGAGAGGFACYWAFRYVAAHGAQGAWPRVRFLVSGGASCLALAALAFRYGFSVQLLELGCFAAILLSLSLTDLEMRTIPNECLALAAAVRLAYLAGGCASGALGAPVVFDCLVGAVAVGAFLLLFTGVVNRMTGTESMGGGDLKLYCVAALYFGWAQGLAVVALSCLIALLAAAVLALRERRVAAVRERALPFGPFISVACLVVMLAA